MMRAMQLILILAMTVLGGAGCATSTYDQGRKLLAQSDYDGAIGKLAAALEETPDDVRVLVDLAEAHYHLDRLAAAKGYLERARQQVKHNGEVILRLGLVHEKKGEIEEAIGAYRDYTQVSRLKRTRKRIQVRLHHLLLEQIRRDIDRALSDEADLDLAAIPEHTVAVLPFRHLGTDRALAPLEKGLAEMMITDLSQVEVLQVVERVRIQAMLQEMGLAAALGSVTGPRMGRLIGVRKIVGGSFTDLADEQIRFDVSAVSTLTGAMEASEAAGALSRIFRLQKRLTFKVIDGMGIELKDEERERIQRIPTENLLAFIAYAQALDFEDRGLYDKAAEAYLRAVELDPAFAEALSGVERIEGLAQGMDDLGLWETYVWDSDPVLGRLVDERGAQIEAGSEGVDGRVSAEGGLGAVDQGARGRQGGIGFKPVGEAREGVLARLVRTGGFAGAGFIPLGDGGAGDLRQPVEEQVPVDLGLDEAVNDTDVPPPEADGRIEFNGRFEE